MRAHRQPAGNVIEISPRPASVTPEMIEALQRTSGNRAVARLLRQTVRLDREVIDVEVITSRDGYRPPGSGDVYRVGDAGVVPPTDGHPGAGLDEGASGSTTQTGVSQEMSPADWSWFVGAAIIGGSNAGIRNLGRQLKPAEWRALWPNPMKELLRRYEAGQLVLDDEAVLTGYHGVIRTDAGISLDRNEKKIDELLNAYRLRAPDPGVHDRAA